MAKSIWKGEISFGLVSIPVSIVSAQEQDELHFHLLNSKTNARVRYQRVDEETGKEVPWNQIVKGYEVEKDHYILVDEGAIEKAAPEVFKTIDIDEFVNFEDIDILYFSKPYYLVPESKNKKSYVLLREALSKTKKVGVAKVMIRTKESLTLIVPHDHALLLYLVHFKEEVRTEKEINVPTEIVKSYKIADRELKMAVGLIEEMAAEWEPEKYHNEYREALEEWLSKQTDKSNKSAKPKEKKTAKKAEVVDFISLLKNSMKKKKEDKNDKSTEPASRKKANK